MKMPAVRSMDEHTSGSSSVSYLHHIQYVTSFVTTLPHVRLPQIHVNICAAVEGRQMWCNSRFLQHLRGLQLPQHLLATLRAHLRAGQAGLQLGL